MITDSQTPAPFGFPRLGKTKDGTLVIVHGFLQAWQGDTEGKLCPSVVNATLMVEKVDVKPPDERRVNPTPHWAIVLCPPGTTVGEAREHQP